MIEANAVVTRLDGEHAWVRVSAASGGCGRCDEPGGCRSIGLAYALKAPEKAFRLPNRIGAEIGEHVRIRVDGRMPLRGALAIYGTGVALLIAGAAIGHSIAPASTQDLFAVMGALGGLAGCALLNRALLRSRRWRRGFEVEMSKDLPSNSPCTGKFS